MFTFYCSPRTLLIRSILNHNYKGFVAILKCDSGAGNNRKWPKVEDLPCEGVFTCGCCSWRNKCGFLRELQWCMIFFSLLQVTRCCCNNFRKNTRAQDISSFLGTWIMRGCHCGGGGGPRRRRSGGHGEVRCLGTACPWQVAGCEPLQLPGITSEMGV